MTPNAEPRAMMPDPSLGPSQDFEDFIYLISHDVRSSVRALLELPHWIAEDLEEAGVPLEGSVANSIELMNRHAGRLDRMLVDLLTFSRIGRMQTVRDNDLNDVLDRVLEEVSIPPGFSVVRSFEVTTVPMGDRDILTLFSALILNGIKHHDKPGGRIVVTSRVEGTDIVIGVADDGPGIPPDQKDRVFGAMQTLRPRDEVEGSGMGLAFVRKIAMLCNGVAEIKDSPYGRGSLAELRLKAAAP